MVIIVMKTIENWGIFEDSQELVRITSSCVTKDVSYALVCGEKDDFPNLLTTRFEEEE